MNDLRSLSALILIPFAWVTISFLMAKLSGWSLLAKRYRCTSVVRGEKARFRTARLGVVQYHSCLTFIVAEQGLRVSVALPFRLGHPPLMIPWDQLHRVQAEARLYSQRVKLSIGHPTLVRAVLPGWVRYRLPAEIRPRSV